MGDGVDGGDTAMFVTVVSIGSFSWRAGDAIEDASPSSTGGLSTIGGGMTVGGKLKTREEVRSRAEVDMELISSHSESFVLGERASGFVALSASLS